MRFRLRYLHHDLELSEGEFAIGRSPECQLSLDDPLVSRRHALLVVSKEAVTVEDLGSRNGVLIDGVRMTERKVLRPGDKILIGSQELTLLHGLEGVGLEATDVQVGKHTLPAIILARRREGDPQAAVATAAALGGDVSVRPTPVTPGEAFDPDAERRTDVFSLLGRVAEKALAMGRAEEAERLLAGPLGDVVEACRARKALSPALVDIAARFAAKLATATAKGAWVDYVVELYDVEVRLCPAPVIDELNTALRKVSAVDLVRLRHYVSRLRERQGALGPADRFLLQRIEGLERLAALR